MKQEEERKNELKQRASGFDRSSVRDVSINSHSLYRFPMCAVLHARGSRNESRRFMSRVERATEHFHYASLQI